MAEQENSESNNQEFPQDYYEMVFVADPKCAIPVGPRFQVDVPKWTDHPSGKNHFRFSYNDLDASKWLGTRDWAPQTNRNQENELGNIGEGRPDICQCSESGSIECVKKHLSEKRARLMSELKVVFSTWGFHKMGEEAISSTWNQEEEEQFEALVRKYPLSKGKSFLDPEAVVCLTTKTRQEMIYYYYDVYLPRKMSVQIRSGKKMVDTDNEGGEEDAPTARGSGRKRARDKQVVARRYLAGLR